MKMQCEFDVRQVDRTPTQSRIVGFRCIAFAIFFYT
jgi:hypothetical protein